VEQSLPALAGTEDAQLGQELNQLTAAMASTLGVALPHNERKPEVVQGIRDDIAYTRASEACYGSQVLLQRSWRAP
jgi:hypothetical protein